ncbi:hypothetical protein [Ferdinandcohnia sp. SAFN-114]|uniref:hypothetical protein n=1 Tax=Ferdinandcohnia sp. SAFN-114 TaxID=3387275 RepID=UPI003F7F7CEA
MNKNIVFIAILSFSLLLSACSSEKKPSEAKAAGEEKGKKEVSKGSLEEFGTTLQKTIEGSNTLLDNFNKNLDGLYTAEVSNQQFANV